MGKSQRDKGKRFEREVAAPFRAMFGEQVRRGWQAREGHDAPDVDGVPRFRIEAKHHALVNIPAAIRQSLVDREKAKDDRWVLAVTKSNRCVPLATMQWSEFMQLLKEWTDAKTEAEDAYRTLENTGALLTKIADTLLGEPPPDTLHDWSRLPELIRQIRALGVSVKGDHPTTYVVLDEERR